MQNHSDAFDYILPHIISIGSSLGNKLEFPIGSGTLVTFYLQINGVPTRIYGILSANHVIEKINLVRHNPSDTVCIGLTKPADRLGTSYNETCSVRFIYSIMDKKHLRNMMQSHKIENNYERDIGFICLGVGTVNIQSVLIKNSEFFDLDLNPVITLPKTHNQPFVFFKGACSDELVQDEILATELIVEQGGTTKRYPKSKIFYHEINNTRGYSMKGASGTGLWMFGKDRNDNIFKILKGIIIEGNNNSTNAIDISYVKESFISKLENFIKQTYLLKDD